MDFQPGWFSNKMTGTEIIHIWGRQVWCLLHLLPWCCAGALGRGQSGSWSASFSLLREQCSSIALHSWWNCICAALWWVLRLLCPQIWTFLFVSTGHHVVSQTGFFLNGQGLLNNVLQTGHLSLLWKFRVAENITWQFVLWCPQWWFTRCSLEQTLTCLN